MHFGSRTTRVLAGICAGATLLAGEVHARLVVMHGYADYTSATLWVQADRAGEIALEVAPEAGGEPRRFVLAARTEENAATSVRVPGLAPGTAYRYRVTAEGEVREGILRTQRFAARAEDAPELVVAFGSCHLIANANAVFPGTGGDYQIFDAIADKHPDLMLWLGDNLYLQTPDFTDPTSMAARYRQARGFAPLQRLLTATAHVAIWDDHDYGPNNSDRSYVFKGESLALFKRYWPNPTFGLPDVPGTFGWLRLGDVEIFLLDDRFHRYPDRYPPVPEKSMFGARQLEWLEEALLTSTARIKIVANGNQLWNRVSRAEGLHQYPDEQQRLARWLEERRIDGVVFLSGDRHFGELLRLDRPGTYPLYEATSSPLTYKAIEHPDPAEQTNPDLVPGTLQTRRNFGMLRISGPRTNRRIAFEAYDSDGALLWRHEVAANDLRTPRPAR